MISDKGFKHVVCGYNIYKDYFIIKINLLPLILISLRSKE